MGIKLLGTGFYVPDVAISNEDMAKLVDTSDAWIRERTGICSRRIAVRETLLDMALAASRQALDDAGIAPDEVDLIIVGTLTGEVVMPSTACLIQGLLEIQDAVAFDIRAACVGFGIAIATARDMLEAGNFSTALVVGADKLSRIINWEDRNSCVLFGDGAGAVVISRGGEPRSGAYFMRTTPDMAGALTLRRQGGRFPYEKINPDFVPELQDESVPLVHMKGTQVFRYAVTAMRECMDAVLDKAGVTMEDIQWVIPHQANKRIIDAVVHNGGWPAEKFFVNIDRYGNTSAASVPIVLAEMRQDHRVAAGDLALLVAFGGGLGCSAMVVEL
ncbi:MAG: ketoacyl-ACP synthase III [Peptococcaceae bacterium]|nr:ketoacyl-ACP synthase III [Peptococcaceae bacterium]